MGIWERPRPAFLDALSRELAFEPPRHHGLDTVATIQAMHEGPSDELAWQALADWLEEQGDPRGELLRLTLELRAAPAEDTRKAQESRVQALLAAGVRPCVPLLTNRILMGSRRLGWLVFFRRKLPGVTGSGRLRLRTEGALLARKGAKEQDSPFIF